MSNLENFRADLTCPITWDLFDDPIQIPCCGKSVTRLALYQHLEINPNKECPLCRGSLENFDTMGATKNTTLAGLVDSLKQKTPLEHLEENIEKDKEDKQKWSSSLIPVVDRNGNFLPIAELKVVLENAMFVTKPSLFIAVVDRSGSMAGSRWKQVETALIHIMSLTKSNSMVKTIIVAYASIAEIINTGTTTSETNTIIKNMFTGGGTNFNAAYEKVKEVLSQFICSDDEHFQYQENNVSNVTVAFLTDGQAMGDRNKLVSDFKEILDECGVGPISVHSIGFGSGCNKPFLEELRKTGNIEGTFRYAEPQDDGDTLCHKLQSLFEVASKSSIVPVNLKLDQLDFRTKGDKYSKELNIQFQIDKNKRGAFTHWVKIISNNFGTVVINSHLDDNVLIPVTLNQNNKKPSLDRWFSTLTDELASELLDLSNVNKEEYGISVVDLHCALIQQRVEAVGLSTGDENILQRLEFISQQVDALRSGSSINMGKLGDMRFSSQFKAMVVSKKPNVQQNNVYVIPPQKLIDEKPAWKERPVRYSRNNDGKRRNSLQEAIISYTFNMITSQIQQALDNSTYADITHRDINGNTALTLAAYCGNSEVVKIILDKYPDTDVEVTNDDGETAMTLAIKKRGFWKVMKVLIDKGATIPAARRDALEQAMVIIKRKSMNR